MAQQGAMPMLVPHDDGSVSSFWIQPTDDRGAQLMYSDNTNERIIQQIALCKREHSQQRFARSL